MENEDLKIIYEDDDVLAVEKPAGIVVFPEEDSLTVAGEKTLIDLLLEKLPYLKDAGPGPRYGMVHRLDKDTSGIILVAKNEKSLKFLQEQFQARKVTKKYTALAVGNLKTEKGTVETFIDRSPGDRRKQVAYPKNDPRGTGKRIAISDYKVLQKFKNYDLIEIEPKTGRKHQIRAHLVYLSHPLAGDKLYGFKNQPCPKGLERQFLHASYLKIELPKGEVAEFRSELPEDLANTLKTLEIK